MIRTFSRRIARLEDIAGVNKPGLTIYVTYVDTDGTIKEKPPITLGPQQKPRSRTDHLAP
jgi:hypothetical protein